MLVDAIVSNTVSEKIRCLPFAAAAFTIRISDNSAPLAPVGGAFFYYFWIELSPAKMRTQVWMAAKIFRRVLFKVICI